LIGCGMRRKIRVCLTRNHLRAGDNGAGRIDDTAANAGVLHGLLRSRAASGYLDDDSDKDRRHTSHGTPPRERTQHQPHSWRKRRWDPPSGGPLKRIGALTREVVEDRVERSGMSSSTLHQSTRLESLPVRAPWCSTA
jgi:hypothetical protein